MGEHEHDDGWDDHQQAQGGHEAVGDDHEDQPAVFLSLSERGSRASQPHSRTKIR
jgi:hypothetical protein